MVIPDSEEQYVLEMKDEVEISEEVAEKNPELSSVEQIETALKETALESGILDESKCAIVYMEITLKVLKEDGSWEIVTAESFPAEKVRVTIPYPEGVEKDKYDFVVTHLISSGEKAGQIEILTHEKAEGGLVVQVSSLSPFAVAYQEAEVTETPDTEPGTAESTDNTPGVNGSMTLVESPVTGDTTSTYFLTVIMVFSIFGIVLDIYRAYWKKGELQN